MTDTRSAPQIWETALGELEIQVNKSNFRTWLVNTSGMRIEEDRFILGVPNTFVAEYLNKNQRSLIEKVLAGIVDRDIQVEFLVDASQQPVKVKGNGRDHNAPVEQTSLPLFNPRYTFDSFVVGNSNQMAFTAATGVAREPGASFNPLYIYGSEGLGKTHLLQAIGQEALARNLKVLYVRAEEYTNQMVSALKDKKTEEFRSKFRNVDMLLIDDIQFFSGKTQTEEAFFHTFDELHNANRQIAVTGNCPPKSIPAIQSRLRSRLEWGLVTDIQSPDFDTRMSILETKAKNEGVEISEDALELIALQIQQSIRSLEGSLNRVIAYARLIRSMVTPEVAARALKDISHSETPPVPASPSLITEAVVNSFQLSPADLRGRKRDEGTALARQVAMYLMRQETDCSLAEIGREFGGRTPATVSHAYQKIADDINNNPALRRKVYDIQQDIYSSLRSPFSLT